MVIQSWIAQAHSAARFAIVVPVLAGCKPDLIGRPSVVDSPQVIAIRSTPAEAQAQQQVTYDVMVAQPLDDTTAPAFDWALCLASKPLATTGPIAESCLAPSGPDLQHLGSSQVVTATLPSDDCQLFGPTPPAQKPGQPAVRPVDPDTTGGYYQPVRLLAQYASSDSQYDVGVTRISCGIESGATQAQTVEFAQNYRPNQNPGISQITFTTGAGASIVIDLTATSVASVNIGANLNFEVTWPSCPLSPICGDNICSAGEDVSNCPSDCQNPQGCEGSEPDRAMTLSPNPELIVGSQFVFRGLLPVEASTTIQLVEQKLKQTKRIPPTIGLLRTMQPACDFGSLFVTTVGA